MPARYRCLKNLPTAQAHKRQHFFHRSVLLPLRLFILWENRKNFIISKKSLP